MKTIFTTIAIIIGILFIMNNIPNGNIVQAQQCQGGAFYYGWQGGSCQCLNGPNQGQGCNVCGGHDPENQCDCGFVPNGQCDYTPGRDPSCEDLCLDYCYVQSQESCVSYNCQPNPSGTPSQYCQSGGGGGGGCETALTCQNFTASASGGYVPGAESAPGVTPYVLNVNVGEEVYFDARNVFPGCTRNDWHFIWGTGQGQCAEHYDEDGEDHGATDTYFCAKDSGATYRFDVWTDPGTYGVPVTTIPLRHGAPYPNTDADWRTYCRPWCHAGDLDDNGDQVCKPLGQGYECEVESPYTEDGNHNKSIAYADGKAYKTFSSPGLYHVTAISNTGGSHPSAQENPPCQIDICVGGNCGSATPTPTNPPAAPTIRIRGRTEVPASGGSVCQDLSANYQSGVTIQLRNPSNGAAIGSAVTTDVNGLYSVGNGQIAGSYLVCALETANLKFDQGSETSPYNVCPNNYLVTPAGHPNEKCLSYSNISGDANNGRLYGYVPTPTPPNGIVPLLACYDYNTSTHLWSVQLDWSPSNSANAIIDDEASYATPWKMNTVGVPPQTSSYNIASRTNIYSKVVYQSNSYYPAPNPAQCDNCNQCYGNDYCGASQSCTGTICSNFICVTPTTVPNSPTPTRTPTPTITPVPLAVTLACYDYDTSTHQWAVQASWSPNVSANVIVDDEASYAFPWKMNNVGIPPQTTAYNISSRTNIYTRATYQGGQNYPSPNPATCDNCQFCLGQDYCGSSQSCTGTICSNFTCVTPTATPTPTNTPTPTATPTPGAWIKLSNACFATQGGFTNIIPNTVSSYDGQDPGNKVFIENQAGVMTASGGISFGNFGGTVSQQGWQKASYSFTNNNLLSFIDYVKSRKEYVTHGAVNQFETNKINFINGGDITLTSLPGSGVLIVTNSSGQLANVTIDADLTAADNVAIIANNIIFTENAKDVHGIFIANSATINNFSNPTADGLKITGNLVLTGQLTNNRRRSDPSAPTVFIVASPQMYVSILPYLSTSTYEWKQLQ